MDLKKRTLLRKIIKIKICPKLSLQEGFMKAAHAVRIPSCLGYGPKSFKL